MNARQQILGMSMWFWSVSWPTNCPVNFSFFFGQPKLCGQPNKYPEDQAMCDFYFDKRVNSHDKIPNI